MLPGGIQTTDEEWGKLSPDEQNKVMIKLGGQNPKTQGMFDKLNTITNAAFANATGGPGAMADAVSNPNSVENRMKWGTVGAAAGIPSGPTGAALTGAGAAANPPQSFGDVASMAIGGLTGGLWPKAEKALQGAGWLKKALTRGAMGAGQDLAETGVKNAMGEKSDSSVSAPISGGIAALTGALGDRALKNVNVKGAKDAASQMAAENGPGGQYIANEINQRVNSNVDAAKKELYEATSTYHTLKQQEAAMIIATPTSMQDKAKLAEVQDKLKTAKGQIDGLSHAPNIAKSSGLPLDAKILQSVDSTGKLQVNPPDLLTQASDKLTDLYSQAKKINEQDLDPLVKKSALSDVKRQIEDLDSKATDLNFKNLSAAAESGDQNKIITAKMQIQQSIIDGLTNKLNNPEFAFNVDPRVKALVGNGSIEDFKKNLASSSSESIKGLQDMWQSDPDGVKKMNTIKQMAYEDIFSKAYDIGSKSWKNLDQAVGPNGDWNPNKLQALFGGGGEGYETANKFSSVAKDLQALTSSTFSKPGAMAHGALSLPTVAAIALPAHLALHIPFTTALGAAELGTAMVISIPKIIDATMGNPTLYKAFHSWVQQGATAEALRNQPQLKKWLDSNSNNY